MVVTAGLVSVAGLGWVYLVYLARGMSSMDMSADLAMPQMQTWGVVDLALLFVMWAVMMVAMMVPSASPLILVVAAANRKRRERDHPLVPTGLFLLGYLLAWTAFSAAATAAQWGLHTTALLSPAMVGTSPSRPAVRTSRSPAQGPRVSPDAQAMVTAAFLAPVNSWTTPPTR